MTFDDLLTLIADTSGLEIPDATPDTPIDGTVDSLGLVALLLHIEEHGVPVPDELVSSWETLGDVHAQVHRWYQDADAGASRPAAGGQGDRLSALAIEHAHVVTLPVLPEHVPALHDLATRGRNAYAWWQRGRSVSRTEFEDRLWSDVALQEVVVDRASGQLLGIVRITDYHERDGHAQLMVLGSPDHRSRLIEGVGLVVARAFTMWPLRKLYLMVPAYNDVLLFPRRELLVAEGCLVGHEHFDGEYHDLHIYGLHRAAFEQYWSG